MVNDAEVVITRLIAGIAKMARKEFSDFPLSNTPFEIFFPLDGDDHDHAKLVCEGLQLGLSEDFGASSVSAVIEDSRYKVHIER